MRDVVLFLGLIGYSLLGIMSVHEQTLYLGETTTMLAGTLYATQIIIHVIQHGAHLIEKEPAFLISVGYGLKSLFSMATNWGDYLHHLAYFLLTLGYLLAILYNIFNKKK